MKKNKMLTEIKDEVTAGKAGPSKSSEENNNALVAGFKHQRNRSSKPRSVDESEITDEPHQEKGDPGWPGVTWP